MESIARVFLISAGFLTALSTYATCNMNLSLTKPDSIYIDNGNGTISDKKTHLMWQKCIAGQNFSSNSCIGNPMYYNWQDAMKIAQDANINSLYGYSDWRLPNIKDLATLVERSCYLPAINNNIFPLSAIKQNYFLSGTNTPSGSQAWVINFSYGNSEMFVKNHYYYIRLVRESE